MPHDPMRALSAYRGRSLLTLRQTPGPDGRRYSMLDVILGRLGVLQREAREPIAVAVISGPNNHEVITDQVQNRPSPGDLDVEIIQQAANPVFTPEGAPLFWDDGPVLQAPDGTGGCLAALQGSRWFADQAARGREFVYVWYGNDLAAGDNLQSVVGGLADAACAWSLDDLGERTRQELAGVPIEEHDPRLVETLEDCGAACAFRVPFLDVMVRLCTQHPVDKEVPVLRPDGSWARGVKRERFLSDIVRRQ